METQERFKKVVTKERQGNTYHTDPDSIDQFPHRHLNAQGEVGINSENFDPRKTVDGSSLHGEPTQAGAQAPQQVKGGIHPFKGTPTESKHLQRDRISNREEVKDAAVKSLSDKRFKNEKDQRRVGKGEDGGLPRGQR